MARADAYPRVLIVTPTILNHVRGGGVTLSRLFAGWPLDALAQIHADILPPATDVCRTYYSVGGPFYTRAAAPGMRRLLHFAAFLTGTGEHGLAWARISGRLSRWLDAYRPDVVFSQTGSPGFLRLTELIRARTQARLILHASDDWVSDWPANVLGRDLPIAGPRIAAAVQRQWRGAVAQADALMAISRPMADAYHALYGREWTVFGNAIDRDSWPDPGPRVRGTSDPFRVMYSGSVIPTSQLEGLTDLARAVTDLRRSGFPAELVISTADPVPRTPELSGPDVRIVPLVPREDVPGHLASADALFLPSVFVGPARRFYGLSMPGKTAEYLASGRPVVTYAPPDSALAMSVRADGWAELVDRRDPALLAAAIRRLALPTSADALVRRARTVLNRDHDLAVMRPEFQRRVRLVGERSE